MPAFGLAEPRGEEAQTGDQQKQAPWDPHQDPSELLVSERIDVVHGPAIRVERIDWTRREREQSAEAAGVDNGREDVKDRGTVAKASVFAAQHPPPEDARRCGEAHMLHQMNAVIPDRGFVAKRIPSGVR